MKHLLCRHAQHTTEDTTLNILTLRISFPCFHFYSQFSSSSTFLYTCFVALYFLFFSVVDTFICTSSSDVPPPHPFFATCIGVTHSFYHFCTTHEGPWVSVCESAQLSTLIPRTVITFVSWKRHKSDANTYKREVWSAVPFNPLGWKPQQPQVLGQINLIGTSLMVTIVYCMS